MARFRKEAAAQLCQHSSSAVAVSSYAASIDAGVGDVTGSQQAAAVASRSDCAPQKHYYGNRSQFMDVYNTPGDQQLSRLLPAFQDRREGGTAGNVRGGLDLNRCAGTGGGLVDNVTTSSLEDQNAGSVCMTGASFLPGPSVSPMSRQFRSTGTDPIPSAVDLKQLSFLESPGLGAGAYLPGAESERSRVTAVASYSDASDIFSTPSLYHPVNKASSAVSSIASNSVHMESFYLGSVNNTPSGSTTTPARAQFAQSYIGDYSQAAFDSLFQNNSPLNSHPGSATSDGVMEQYGSQGDGSDSFVDCTGPASVVAGNAGEFASGDPVALQYVSEEDSGAPPPCFSIRDLLMMSPPQTNEGANQTGSAAGLTVESDSNEDFDPTAVAAHEMEPGAQLAVSSAAPGSQDECVVLLLESKGSTSNSPSAPGTEVGMRKRPSEHVFTESHEAADCTSKQHTHKLKRSI
jgi:hypothetical protein